MKPSNRILTVALFATFALTACPSPQSSDPTGLDAGVNHCGDGLCENNETAGTCPADCHGGGSGSGSGSGSGTGGSCGDHVCNGTETATSCPADCAVCGDGVCSSTENGTSCPADCDANLKVNNETTSYTIWYLYLAPCGASTWSSDQLGAHVIAPSTSFTLTAIPPGCWYFRADTQNDAQQWISNAFTLTAGETFNWNLLN